MTDIKIKYGSSNQPITITLASLADDGLQESSANSNVSNLFLNALVQLKVKTGASTAGDKNILVYAYGTADGGTTYSGDASGNNGAFGGNIANCVLMGIIDTPTAATAYESNVMNVANAFGGVLPDHWGIIVKNQTGATLDGAENNFSKFYQGVLAQSG